MSTFVLIHGAWHGAWCWRRVVPLLEAAGHHVRALDMPAMGDDQTPVAEATFDKSVATIRSALEQSPEPVILVGHSMGGIVITQMAEEMPEKLAKLVYLTAFLPKSGQSCLSLASMDSGTVPYGLEFAADGASAIVRGEWAKASFYADCTEAEVTEALPMLSPQSLDCYAHPVSVTEARAGRVPRIYIECLRDHAITPGFQRKMYTDNPCQRVLTLDTGHSPFLNAPGELADLLLSTAA